MAYADNTGEGPPPLQTPITAQGPDEFGVPFQNRGLASGNLNITWGAWFASIWERIIRAILGTKAATILNGAITNVALAMVVDSATGFPAVPFVVQIDSEQINVTVKAGVNWTITRAANGTTAAAHADNAPVILKPIVTPGRLVKVESDGEMDESGIAITDVVLGAASLTNAGAIPKVASTGTLSESALKDDGTVLTLLARLLDANKTIRSTGFQDPVAGSGIEVKYDTGVGVGLIVVYNRTGAAWLPLALYGSTISFLPQGGTTTNVGTLDLTGGGVLKVAGTQVVGPRGAALTATIAAATAAGAAYNQAVAQTCVDLANRNKTRLDELEARLVAHGSIS